MYYQIFILYNLKNNLLAHRHPERKVRKKFFRLSIRTTKRNATNVIRFRKMNLIVQRVMKFYYRGI